MKIFGLRIGEWLWVFYPILVVVIMVVGVNFWLSGGVESLDKMFIKPKQTQENQKEAALLKTKSEKLKGLNKAEAMDKLQKLLVAVPPSKKVWLLLAELQASASEAGVVINSYKATVGDVKEASEEAKPAVEGVTADALSLKVDYEAGSFSNVVALLESMQKMLPLIRVVSVEYDLYGLSLGVESAWAKWQKIAIGEQVNLPEYAAEVEKALKSTEGFVAVSPW